MAEDRGPADDVVTRPVQQCIRKFLGAANRVSIFEHGRYTGMGLLRFARIPLEQADNNPVMSVAAFLAEVVGPGLAAEAAKTALHEVTDDGASDTYQD